MARNKLTDAQKDAIVTVYTSKTRTIKQIAGFLGVSTRTVGRVLEERGIPGPMAVRSAEAVRVMALLYKRKVDPAMMEQILDTPALTPANVAIFLRDCNQAQLSIILQGAGIRTLHSPAGLVALASVTTHKPIPQSAQMPLSYQEQAA